MYALRRVRTAMPSPVLRERSQRRPDETGALTADCRQACREVEAARLVLAELGRRHGPVD